MALDLKLKPADLEGEAEELQVLHGASFSHVALAESMWNDKYGEFGDPGLLGLTDEERRDRNYPAELWQAFKLEYYELTCTSSAKYKNLRAKVANLKGSSATVIVSSIAAGIASTVGLAAAVLVPFVAILLHGALTVGNNVMCRAMKARLDSPS